MALMLKLYAGEQGVLNEVPPSRETFSATGPVHPFFTPSILDEPGGNEVHALRPGTEDPTISTALSLDPVTRDNDGRAQSDTAPAANAAISPLFEDIAELVSMLKEEPGGERAVAEGEETPETGRGNEQPLSEDDNMSLSPGDPDGDQNTSRARRVNTTGASDMQVGPRSGALPQAQPSQVYPPVQASFGNLQPMPNQPMPHQPMPHQPMPYHPWRHQSLPPQAWPQQYLPYYTPGNPYPQFFQQAAAGLPPPQPPEPPHMQPVRHEGYANQGANHGFVYAGTTYFSPTDIPPTAFGGGPFQALAYPQLPSQNSSEGGPQARTPANTQVSTRPGNAADGFATVYSNQVPANFTPSPRMSLPPNINAPTQPQVWNRQAAGSGLQDLRMRDPQQRHTGFGPQSGSDFRPRHPSQLGPPMGTFQPPHVISTLSHEGPQRSEPPLQSATGHHSAQGPLSATSRRVEGPEPGYFATDIPRVTTPEVEYARNSLPSMRDESVLNLRIYLLASRISVRQRRGQPYTGLPGVTAEEVQSFRLQYRSMPVFTWSREGRVSDELVKVTLQAMKLLGLSLGRLWQLRQSTGSGQSASGTQSANPAESAQLPGTTQPDDDGYVPEYLLDRFVEILELSGEQQALRFLRESKARAARESRSSNRSRRKRRNAMMGMSDESRISSMGRVIDDDLSAFGITSVQNARGQIMMAGSSRRRENVNSSPALNRTIEIHIDDDLVGAAESSTPVEKFRRLMNSSPTQKNPKKKKRAKA